jgi:hypothetical protein
MAELDEFLKSIKPEESILDKPLDVTPEAEEPEKNLAAEEEIKKNRYTRRREAEAQRLRDENLQLNERVKVLSELGKFKEEVGDDPLKKIEAIFGTDTPEKLAATNLLKEAISGMSERAKAEALQEIDSRGEKETEAQKEADDEVDGFLETAEDEGLDIEDENTRKGLITLMERMSSKYSDGNVKEFADPEAVIETYKELQKRQSSNKAKELSSRSMTRSGESQPSKLPQNAIERYMSENGLQGNW